MQDGSESEAVLLMKSKAYDDDEVCVSVSAAAVVVLMKSNEEADTAECAGLGVVVESELGSGFANKLDSTLLEPSRVSTEGFCDMKLRSKSPASTEPPATADVEIERGSRSGSGSGSS